MNPYIKASFADYATTILTIKQEIGSARMNITTKSLEFLRVLYGGPRSDIVFIIMYTCQGCGLAPRYDYDYSFQGRKGASTPAGIVQAARPATSLHF